MNEFPRPISLPFSYLRRERSVALYRGVLELADDGKRVACGDGELLFAWLPRPGVVFVLPDQRLVGVRGRDAASHADLDLDASVILRSWHIDGGDIRGVINRAPFAATDQIRELRFAVANYLFMNRAEPLAVRGRGHLHYWAGRNVLKTDEFELTLDERPRLRQRKDA